MIVEDCEDIHIQGLGMLHSSPGWCTGDALVIHNSRHLTVKNCDISGSGVVGVVATHSADLAIDDNHIHHCTYETIYLSHVFGVEIRGNLLRENEEQDTSEEGISVNQVHGKIEISGNTFVDNRSAPVTIYREKPGDNALPYGKILITKNIFSRSKSPHKQASIHDSCPDQDYCVPGMETVKITGNCFDMTRDRGDIHAHVSRGAETKDNRVVPLTLTGSFQVKYPKECTSAGAGVIPWLDKAREPTPE